MRLKVLMFTLVSMFLLTACQSDADVDRKVIDYVKDTYGFEVEITERESLNEGNMGNRTFIVKRLDDPQVAFEVYLEGLFVANVVGDNYEKQVLALVFGERVLNNYHDEIDSLNFNDIQFSWKDAMHVDITYEKHFSIYDENAVKELYDFIHIVNQVREYEGNRDNFTMNFHFNDDEIFLLKLDTVTSIEQFKKEWLYYYSDIMNYSIIEKNYGQFLELEKQLEELGFVYSHGIELHKDGPDSFACYQQYYENAECSEGYRLRLDTKILEKTQLFELVTFLNNHPTLTFKDVSVFVDDQHEKYQGERIYFEDVKIITDISQVVDLLKEKERKEAIRSQDEG